VAETDQIAHDVHEHGILQQAPQHEESAKPPPGGHLAPLPSADIAGTVAELQRLLLTNFDNEATAAQFDVVAVRALELLGVVYPGDMDSEGGCRLGVVEILQGAIAAEMFGKLVEGHTDSAPWQPARETGPERPPSGYNTQRHAVDAAESKSSFARWAMGGRDLVPSRLPARQSALIYGVNEEPYVPADLAADGTPPPTSTPAARVVLVAALLGATEGHEVHATMIQQLRGARLELANLVDLHLEEVDLYEANLQGGQLTGLHLKNGQLFGACLKKADLNGSQLRKADLRCANMEEAILTSVHFEEAILCDAKLDKANLISAHMQKAKLKRVSLQKVAAHWVNFEHANLRYANLEGVELFKANLQGAQLEESYMQGALLDRANMRGARLSRAVIGGGEVAPTEVARFEESGMRAGCGTSMLSVCPGPAPTI
jgi:uncharacterized protein YjbI with pentapeptide repeats